MTAKNKSETGEAPAIRDLQIDEIDSVSGGTRPKAASWTDPNPEPVQDPKPPGWTDPNPIPVR